LETLLTVHPLTDNTSLAACRLCHHLTGDGEGHLKAAHPRRYALAQERQ
jgi:hypothetical protein